jgi:glycerophosphoryl diester phosphodiesterase
MSKTIHVQAHRGASYEKTENTLEAFKTALEIGADSIELDVHLSSDGVPFVFHDFVISPEKTEGLQRSCPIKELSFDEITSLKWKSGRSPIPSLEEVFKELSKLDTAGFSWLDIELKREPNSLVPATEVFVSKVIQLVNRFWKLEKATFRSFDFDLLKEIKSQCSSARITALIDEKNRDFSKIISELKPNWIAPYFKTLSEEKIRIAHQLGVKVMPYTVNEQQDWEKLINWGVDGMTTDKPRALLDYIKRKGI